jgi:hypothetical protein
MAPSAGRGARRFGGTYRLRFQGQNIIEEGNRQRQNQISLSLCEYWSPGTTMSGASNKTRFHFMQLAFMGPCISDIVCTKKRSKMRDPNLKTLDTRGANGNAIRSSELVGGWGGSAISRYNFLKVRWKSSTRRLKTWRPFWQKKKSATKCSGAQSSVRMVMSGTEPYSPTVQAPTVHRNNYDLFTTLSVAEITGLV